MSEGAITRLLAMKHAKDVFVSQCKDGPTGSGLSILDAWAMKRSWAHPLTIGYEIKVSRSDFVKDTKWQSYLDYCNEFYFVCPAGVIKRDEVGEHSGLLWVSNTGARVYTKKKAPYRDVDIPEALYRYILMCRAEIDGPEEAPRQSRTRDYWERWMAQAETDREFGHRVSKKIRQVVESRIRDVERRNADLLRRMEAYDDLMRFLESIGIGEGFYSLRQKVVRAIDGGLADLLGNVVSSAANAKDKIDQIRSAALVEKSSREE
jgi:hypothetical protein